MILKYTAVPSPAMATRFTRPERTLNQVAIAPILPSFTTERTHFSKSKPSKIPILIRPPVTRERSIFRPMRMRIG